MNRVATPLLASAQAAVVLLNACSSPAQSQSAREQAGPPPPAASTPAKLETVYQGPTLWVGITVSDDGRTFVLYPHPTGGGGLRVAEMKNGQPQPYPNQAWNDWQPGAATAHTFVRGNALRIGPDGLLWVVDTGTARMGSPVLPGGPKLVAIDLHTNQVVRTLPLDDVVKPASLVDDVRRRGTPLHRTEAGAPARTGRDTQTGRGRRVRQNDPSTTARRPLYAEGTALTDPAGKPVRVHTDQLEVSPDGKYLYFQVAAGPLYRVETRYLNDPHLPAAALSRQVKLFYDTPSTGGTAIDAAGHIYLADPNRQRIIKITPDAQATTLLTDKRLLWPDALWLDNHGNLWIPAAQLNRIPSLHGGVDAFQPPVYRYKLPIGAPPFRS